MEKRFNRPLNKGRTHSIIKNDNNCSIKQTLETHVRGLKFSPGPPSDLYQRQRSTSLLKKSKKKTAAGEQIAAVNKGEVAGQGVCFLVDFYFLSSVFQFCFPCMVGTSTGTACDGSWGQWERKG